MPVILRLALTAAAAGLLAWLALVGFVVVKKHSVPAPQTDTQAIIVLGAQVKADGTMSLQLTWRMEKALETYRAHPQIIVVCGAQGEGEPMSEAHRMRDFLLENGVPDADIVTEDTSFNTRQNLQNARSLLPEDTERVLVVTSDYHLPRAMAIASDAGFASVSGVGSPIKAIYWPKNYLREALAWVKYWMQDIGILSY